MINRIMALGPIKLAVGFIVLGAISFGVIKWVPFFHQTETNPTTQTETPHGNSGAKSPSAATQGDTNQAPEQTGYGNVSSTNTSQSRTYKKSTDSVKTTENLTSTDTSTQPAGKCSGSAHHVAGASDGTGSCWPGPDNTGVPSGTTLTNYSGPCVISADNTIIDSKTVNCALSIQAANVVIKNSKINGNVIVDVDRPGSNAWHLTIQDSEVDAGAIQEAALGWGNLTATRIDVHGGVTSIQCEENSVSCVVQDSYLHGQYIQPNSNWHLGGFLSDGGGPITLIHN